MAPEDPGSIPGTSTSLRQGYGWFTSQSFNEGYGWQARRSFNEGGLVNQPKFSTTACFTSN